MLRSLIILSAFTLILSTACRTTNRTPSDEEMIQGVWVREGTNGTGPGNTIVFSKKNGVNTMSFDCSGSPGPGWPSNAETEYKFNQGKLSYLNYYDNSMGFYTVNNFAWVTVGQKFQLELREVLLFMSATYIVKYNKVQ